jgi:anti-sigma B factor antagonist
MSLEHEHPSERHRAAGPAKSRGQRPRSGASRRTLTLVSVENTPPDCLNDDTGGTSDRTRPAPAGELAIRRERRADEVILWLTGKLDRATSALLERELDAHAHSSGRLEVDLTGLEFIDSSGLETLARAHQRARKNGHELSTEGSRVISRLLQLSNTAPPRPGSITDPRAANNELYYFALAMACADVDHQRPLGDRSRGTPDRSPTRQQARAAPPLLPSVARAAPTNAELDHPAAGTRVDRSVGLGPRHVDRSGRARGLHSVEQLDRLDDPTYGPDPSRVIALPIRAVDDTAPAA